MRFNVYALIHLVNALCGLTIAIIIFFKRGRKPVQVTYGFFSLLLFFYAFFYFLWGIQTNLESSLFWIQMLMYPACIIHAFYFHFTLVICNVVNRFKKILLCGYASSVIFFIINFFNGLFDLNYIRNKDPFLYWPHATSLVALLILTELFYVISSLYVLVISIKVASDFDKPRFKYLLIAGVIGWLGAITSWFGFYDSIPLPPIGNPAITAYLILTFFLIFKHDLLGLNLVVKRTFIYTLLTLFISLIYALFVAISERLFQSYIGYSSFIGSVLAALTIAILFNPLRDSLTKFTDKRLFGKSIEELSQENYQMRWQLQNQDRMKAVATLAAGMAHEIKNPLTAIKTFTEYLPERVDNPGFIKEFRRIVGAEVGKIDGIVRQLLEFSKPAPLKLERTNIIQIIDDTLHLLDAEFVAHKIEVIRHFYTDCLWIHGDKTQLQQVFLNLFLNSIQAMPNGGKLTVSVFFEPDKIVKVSVADTGQGISKENLPHIFDPFFTTKESGTGLGLAISHGILKEHRCKINIKSDLGMGTVFEMLFDSSIRPSRDS